MSVFMNHTPIVSVVLPFYNAEKTISRAIESIINQTFFDFEFILVDNNSTDNSRQIAETFEMQDDRICLLDEQRQGVSYACNWAIKHARGKYVARMDADDYSLPDRLKKQVAFLDDSKGTDLVATKVEHISVLPSEGMSRFVDWSNRLCSEDQIFLKRFIEQPLITPSLMWRNGIGKQTRFFTHNTEVPEDYYTILELLHSGHKIGKIDEVLHHWHDSDNRLTRTNSRYTVDAFNKAKCEFIMKWLSENVSKGRKISVWGAGKSSRKRSDLLMEMGVEVESYIDLRENTQKEPPVIFYKHFEKYFSNFILTNVTNWGARDKISQFLCSKGLKEGVDYLHIA